VNYTQIGPNFQFIEKNAVSYQSLFEDSGAIKNHPNTVPEKQPKTLTARR